MGDDKIYENDCPECRTITHEFLQQDREYFIQKMNDAIDEKFQTRQDIIVQVNKIPKLERNDIIIFVILILHTIWLAIVTLKLF